MRTPTLNLTPSLHPTNFELDYMAMAPPTPAFTLHTSFSPLIPLYHTFLLDQFGVIHNGSESLHGAVDCIESMVHPSQYKKLAILSNTSSPSHVALKRLKKYGLREDMFVGGLLSSGEECARYVRDTYCCRTALKEQQGQNDDDDDNNNSKKALWFTWEESEKQNPLEFIQHCESGDGNTTLNGGRRIDVANSVQEADFILLHGSEVWRRCRELPTVANKDTQQTSNLIQSLNFMYEEDYSVIDSLLREASQRNLPMVCANPDLIVGLPGGVVANMPGEYDPHFLECYN